MGLNRRGLINGGKIPVFSSSFLTWFSFILITFNLFYSYLGNQVIFEPHSVLLRIELKSVLTVYVLKNLD